MQEALKLLSHLGDDDTHWIFEVGREEGVGADTVLITEGTHPDNVYIVLSGVVDVRASGVVDDTPLAKLGPGELLGEMSFLDGAPASANVVAVEPVLVLTLPRSALRARLDRDPAFGARWYKALAHGAVRSMDAARHRGWRRRQARGVDGAGWRAESIQAPVTGGGRAHVTSGRS